MKVIGVAGQLGNGKDVLCDYLVNVLNDRMLQETPHAFSKEHSGHPLWKRTAFANAVKEVYQSAFGVDREFNEKWKRIADPPPGMLMPVRQGLQFIGDGFRKIKDEVWIEIALRTEPRDGKDGYWKNLIISDSRYINEAKAIRAKGGIMVALYREGYLNDDPNPSESQIKPIVQYLSKYNEEGPITHDRYESDPDRPTGLEYYDFFLRNDGTLQQFYDKIDQLLVPYVDKHYAA